MKKLTPKQNRILTYISSRRNGASIHDIHENIDHGFYVNWQGELREILDDMIGAGVIELTGKMYKAVKKTASAPAVEENIVTVPVTYV